MKLRQIGEAVTIRTVLTRCRILKAVRKTFQAVLANK